MTDEGWQPTDDLRVVPDGDLTIGVVSRVTRDESILSATTKPKFRTERRWVRVWAEYEWRAE